MSLFCLQMIENWNFHLLVVWFDETETEFDLNLLIWFWNIRLTKSMFLYISFFDPTKSGPVIYLFLSGPVKVGFGLTLFLYVKVMSFLLEWI